MYNASAQFHNAVFGNSPVERVLFKFADGTIFTNEDIHIGNGLKVIEAVNLEEELTIGGCPASSLEATIMNYHGLLSGFAFGEAEVSLGVRTEVVVGNPVSANAVTYVGGGQFCGYSTEPYLKLDGEAPAAQPGFPVHSIVADGLVVYCIGLEGQCWKATLASGQTWASLEPDTWTSLEATTWDSLQGTITEVGSVALSAFMTAKAAGWAAQGRGLWSNGGVVYEYYTNGNAETYEYVKLGTFLLNTPAKRKINMIAVSALDKMSLFDREADVFWNGMTYPITVGEIFAQLCAFVGVQKATTSFINSARLLDEAPLAAEGITAREILKWIAEAACSFARMTRDGEVELAWFGTRPVTIPMTQYFGMSPAEYEVAPIDKLQISGSETDIGVIIGEGTNGYQIMDNPLLYGETDTEIRTLGVPIYNRLVAYAAFSPVAATAVCDWSIQAGDIIEIVLNGVTYALPVYSQTITWKGNARVTYESTGAEKRPVMAASNRRVYAQKRAIHEVNETVGGLTRRIEDTEDNVTNLALFADSLTLSVANGSTSSTLKLMAGSTELSSANITLTGVVTFANLTDGVTQISGNNIKTGAIQSTNYVSDSTGMKINLTNGTIDSKQFKLKSDNTAEFSGKLETGVSITSPTINGGTITSGTSNGSKLEITSGELGIYFNGARVGNIHGDSLSYSTLFLNGLNQLCLSVGGDPQITIGSTISVSAELTSGYTGRFYDFAIGNSAAVSSIGTAAVLEQDGAYYYLARSGSRRNLKSHIRTLPYANEVHALRPVLYRPKKDDLGVDYAGFIAEEIEAACPTLATYDGDGKILGVQYERVCAYLVAEAQQAKSERDALHDRIEKIERAIA